MNEPGQQPQKWARVTGEARAVLEQQVVALYAAGASVREISRITGRSYGAVHKMLREAQVTLRRRGRVGRKPESPA